MKIQNISRLFLFFAVLLFSFTNSILAADFPSQVIDWPDTIYTNGIIVTLDEHALNDNPGTIAGVMAVRSAAEIARSKGPVTVVGGKVVYKNKKAPWTVSM